MISTTFETISKTFHYTKQSITIIKAYKFIVITSSRRKKNTYFTFALRIMFFFIHLPLFGLFQQHSFRCDCFTESNCLLFFLVPNNAVDVNVVFVSLIVNAFIRAVFQAFHAIEFSSRINCLNHRNYIHWHWRNLIVSRPEKEIDKTNERVSGLNCYVCISSLFPLFFISFFSFLVVFIPSLFFFLQTTIVREKYGFLCSKLCRDPE